MISLQKIKRLNNYQIITKRHERTKLKLNKIQVYGGSKFFDKLTKLWLKDVSIYLLKKKYWGKIVFADQFN